MAWELEIHIIDVGQGDSSLIIAKDPTTGRQRSMLIDAGRAAYAETVHRYILKQELDNGPDHILVTHYDEDHVGGVTALLLADNISVLSDVVAAAAAREAVNLTEPNTRPDRAAAAAVAAYATVGGWYDDPNGNKFGGFAGVAVLATHTGYRGKDDMSAIEAAIKAADKTLTGPRNSSLIPKKLMMKAIAQVAGKAAAKSYSSGRSEDEVRADTRTAVFDKLSTTVKVQSRFQTGGIYSKVHIIDLGDTIKTSGVYTVAIAGRYLNKQGDPVQVIGTSRRRTGPPELGSEILWNSGRNPSLALDNSPAVFVVSRLKNTWNGIGKDARLITNPAQAENADSIGLIVRFNQFYYFTGGDLGSAGEEQIATAVRTRPLPNPQDDGSPFDAPKRIACFKCGHHGSHLSTSQAFLKKAQPSGAVISCGINTFGEGDHHPTQDLINRLHDFDPLRYFYLTNCKFKTERVPASKGKKNQVSTPWNKSRVAGENDERVIDAASDVASRRKRGDIIIWLDEAESTSGNGRDEELRRYHATYYEEDSIFKEVRTEDIDF